MMQAVVGATCRAGARHLVKKGSRAAPAAAVLARRSVSVLQPAPGTASTAVGQQRRAFAAQGANPFAEDGEAAYATGDLKGYKVYHQKEPFQLSTGATLPELVVAYETWGELNEAKDNAILLQCGMSASSHACSHTDNPQKGWWEDFIGPGKALDTSLFQIICTNNLGGCYGTTGPSSLHPEDNKPWGSRFPRFEVYDMVAAQFKLLDHLGIKKLHACVGSSLGGMQSVCSAASFPDRVSKFISISACAKSFPGTMAFRHAQRTAIMNDPNWNGGNYYGGDLPENGLRLARELGTITYRSGQEWQDRFGQNRFSGTSMNAGGLELEFEIERYLAHQGKKWVNNYDPNSLLWISKAMDGFTMEKPNENGELCLKTGMAPAQQPALVIGVQYDVLFPVWQQKEIADTLRAAGNKRVCYYELDSTFGHDAFLLNAVAIGPAVKGHLEQEPGGAQHLWEEAAQTSRDVLQAVINNSNPYDNMRATFRALAKGKDTVEVHRLKAAAKLLFVKGTMTDTKINKIFADRHVENMSLEDFVALYDQLDGHSTYLP